MSDWAGRSPRDEPSRVLDRIEQALGSWSPLAHVGVTVLLLIGLAVLDYFTGNELAFSIFYLAPVAWATWFLSRSAGVATGVVAAAVWGVIDVASGSVYTSPIIPVWNTVMRFGFFLIILLLLAEIRDTSAARQRMAMSDALTGIANGRAFYSDLDREIERLRRYGHPFAVMYIDLDRFKSVNDTLGHAGGDQLLREVARCLSGVVRDVDTIARLGGDEFGVLMPETDERAGELALRRIADATASMMRESAPSAEGVGATIGAAVFRSAPWSAEHAVRVADELMYEGKRAGRGEARLVVYRGP